MSPRAVAAVAPEGNAFAVPDTTADETPDIDPATWDAAAWIAGATSTVRSVKLHQRADLMAVSDELQDKLRLARMIPADDRALGELSPEAILEQLEQVARQFEASAIVIKVEGRSDESRKAIEKRLTNGKTKPDEDEVTLHQLADAVIEPPGITVDFLRMLRERMQAQYQQVLLAYVQASGQPPAVTLPFSSESSSSRRRDRSS